MNLTRILAVVKVSKAGNRATPTRFFQVAQFTTHDNRIAFMAAFRDVGDGVGTLFVLLNERNGQYDVAWRKKASQAQFRVRAGGGFQRWESDEGDAAFGMHNIMKSAISMGEWGLSKISHYETKHGLAPAPFSETLILIER